MIKVRNIRDEKKLDEYISNMLTVDDPDWSMAEREYFANSLRSDFEKFGCAKVFAER